jgi:hypothetical protein
MILTCLNALKKFLINISVIILISAIIILIIMGFCTVPKVTMLIIIKFYCGIASYSYSMKELQLPQFPSKKEYNNTFKKSFIHFLVFPLIVCGCDYLVIMDLIDILILYV